MRVLIAGLVLAILAGCAGPTVPPAAPPSGRAERPVIEVAATPPPGASQTFVRVMQRVRPAAQQTCRESGTPNCDFAILIDDRPGLPPNAYYTLLPNGRPALAFTEALIGSARNADELAFIAGHEAAHHIEGHIERSQVSGLVGASLAGALASLGGADVATIERAQQVGAFVGQRQFAKEFELEADALGTVIAGRAGYDPVRGAQYFTRIPDPGNRFLGTHPPNADRLAVVRRVAGR